MATTQQEGDWFDYSLKSPQQTQAESNDDWFNDQPSQDNSMSFDKVLTSTLKLAENIVTETYDLGVKTYTQAMKSREEAKNRSFLEDTKQAGKDILNLGKGAGSALTFGYYEPIPEDERAEVFQGIGKFFGVGSAINKISKAFKYGLGGLMRRNIPTAVTVPPALGSYDFGVQTQEIATGKREEYDPNQVAANFLLGAIPSAMIEASPAFKKIKNSLSKKHQLELAKGKLPFDLPDYTFQLIADEVVPNYIENTFKELTFEKDLARNNIDKIYEKQLQEASEKHNLELDELRKENQLNEMSYQEALKNYENEVSAAEAEYQNEIQRLEQENAQAIQEYEKSVKDWNEYTEKNAQISEALRMRARQSNDTSLGYKPAAPTSEIPTTKNSIGNLVSSNEITDATGAGRSLQTGTRMIALEERKPVSELYKTGDKLNDTIQKTATKLAHQIMDEIYKLKQIPSLSTPSNALLNSYRKMLSKLVEFDENGNISGYKEISNKVLLDQAKELRNKVDFDFEAGNPTKIFQDFIDMLQDQAEANALESGNAEAYNANVAARTAHRNWKNRYDHDFIRQLRNESIKDYQSMFDKSLKVDNFQKLEPILNQYPATANLLSAIRRELVLKELEPVINNPGKYTYEQRLDRLRDLKPILTPQEYIGIVDSLSVEAAMQPKIKEPKIKPVEAKKKTVKEPEKPTPKEPKPFEFPPKPKIKETPYMKYLEKELSTTPEKMMQKVSTPSGVKEVKARLDKTPKGQKAYKKLREVEMKKIAYGDKIREKATGKELYERFNKKTNYDLVVEWYDEATAKDLLETFETIADKEVTPSSLEQTLNALKRAHYLNIFYGLLF